MDTQFWRLVAAVPVTVVALALQPAAALQQRGGWPGASWPEAAPASQGLSAAALDALDRDARAGVFGNLNHLVIIRNGYMVVNHRYARDYSTISRGAAGPLGCGEGCRDAKKMHEYNYFHPTWHPYYQGRDVHTLQSVTKSVAATLIGIALGRGELKTLDQPFLEYFEDRDLSKVDPRLRKATIDDLLTMRSGIEWHESDRPLDETNTTYQLESSRDWIAFTLRQPMDAAAGTKWVYNSGGSMLLSGIIRAASGRFIDDYAREHLFTPIGIKDCHWKKTPTGHPDTEGGLYLSADDLARIGYLYLRDGMWDGRRVLPQGWVTRATTRHVLAATPEWDYGYQWWIMSRNGADIWAGRGFGGQILLIIPSRDIVAVANAWNVFGTKARNVLPPLVDALLKDDQP